MIREFYDKNELGFSIIWTIINAIFYIIRKNFIWSIAQYCWRSIKHLHHFKNSRFIFYRHHSYCAVHVSFISSLYKINLSTSLNQFFVYILYHPLFCWNLQSFFKGPPMYCRIFFLLHCKFFGLLCFCQKS